MCKDVLFILPRSEFFVQFIGCLFEVGTVDAVVGLDGRRNVLVPEEHLNDLGVFFQLKQHAGIGVPQGMKVYLILGQSRSPHQPFEHGLGAVICTQCPLVGPENEVFGRGEGEVGIDLLFSPQFVPFK